MGQKLGQGWKLSLHHLLTWSEVWARLVVRRWGSLVLKTGAPTSDQVLVGRWDRPVLRPGMSEDGARHIYRFDLVVKSSSELRTRNFSPNISLDWPQSQKKELIIITELLVWNFWRDDKITSFLNLNIYAVNDVLI